ncbi:conserved hypothetical protein [Solidesulfovibrio fructosivorans JJ]]|uniref:Uncharacterized protein n=1 Tax=Solidesulfovibrio fructosivorans JJ] TaxID=596151 RepID=E1K2F5_SOLFR|nr:hypothetical protein [Solidesulfovibrio fructosivorans]EFL49212.1 conserved hypothetical protein [Solidesulfovibrio fructosivorans JJ]]
MHGRALCLRHLLVVFGLVLAAGFLARPGYGADAPMELAGIRLGETLAEAGKTVAHPETDRSFHKPYLGLAAVAPVPGYRSGYVDYGLCAKPGRIVRLKMNYADESLEFFERILEALTKRYGAPQEWRGNAFRTLRTWKWSLRAAGGEPVSLILMHYEGEDGAFTEGNSIRLAATGMVHDEEVCYDAKYKKSDAFEAARAEAAKNKKLGLDWFLPR